jgi:hypothetical protein
MWQMKRRNKVMSKIEQRKRSGRRHVDCNSQLAAVTEYNSPSEVPTTGIAHCPSVYACNT